MVSPQAYAWDGIDAETGGAVEIGEGNLVRPGEEIEIYDYNSGEYKNVEVQDINRGYGSVDVEVYDYGSGEFSTFEMDE